MILLLTILFFSQTKSATAFLRCDVVVKSSEYWWEDVGATKECKAGNAANLNTKCAVKTKSGGTCTHTPLSASAQPSAPKTINQIQCRQVATTSTHNFAAAWYDVTNGDKVDLSTIQCTSSAPTPTAPSTGAAPAAGAAGAPTAGGKNCAMMYSYFSMMTGITITVNNGGCICQNPQDISCTEPFCAIVEGFTLTSSNVKDAAKENPQLGKLEGTGSYGTKWDYCKKPVLRYSAHVAAPLSHGGKTIEAESSLNYILTENSPILTMFALIGVLAIVYNLGLSAQKVIKKQGDSYDEVIEMPTEDI